MELDSIDLLYDHIILFYISGDNNKLPLNMVLCGFWFRSCLKISQTLDNACYKIEAQIGFDGRGQITGS